MRVAIISGSAAGVWDERKEAMALARSAGAERVFIAINEAGVHHPDPLHHWASWHIDHLYEKPYEWARKRTENGRRSNYVRWSPSRGGNVDRVSKLWKGGSSGLFALGVALGALELDRAILCGVPMDGRENEFTGRPWGDYERFRSSWTRWAPAFGDRARSLSGWTMELLGEPTEEWLTGADEEAA